MKRLRIALVTPLWPVPGAPHAGKPIYETARRLQEYADVEAFCPVPRYPPLGLLRPKRYSHHETDLNYSPEGVHTQYLRYGTLPLVGRFWNGLGTERALEQGIRSWMPDLILAYWLYPTAWAAVRIGRRLKVPVVAGSRGSDLNRIPDRLIRSMVSWTVHHANAVVTVTSPLRNLALQLGADAARTTSIPNGCDAALYRPLPTAQARQVLNLPQQARLIVQVGNLLPSKGVLDLLEAFRRLAAEFRDLSLIFVGEGPAGMELRARAESAALADRVLLPGPCRPEQVPFWLNAADVVCLASHAEGCPNVVVEALSCERPVVACRVGGIPDLVSPECGVLVPPKNPAALAEGLRTALTQAWASGKRFARTWNDVARETYEVCQGVMERH